MLTLIRVLILMLSLSFCSFCFSQTKEDLKKQKLDLEKQIRYTTELLNKTKSNKTKSLNYLRVLDKQIKSKEALLITVNLEISLKDEIIFCCLLKFSFCLAILRDILVSRLLLICKTVVVYVYVYILL